MERGLEARIPVNYQNATGGKGTLSPAAAECITINEIALSDRVPWK